MMYRLSYKIRIYSNSLLFGKALLLASFFMAMQVYGQAPLIQAVDKQKGSVLETLTISGSGFGSPDNTLVFFGANRGQVSEATANSIKVKVPPGATFDRLQVVRSDKGLSAYSASPFMPAFGGGSNINLSRLEPPLHFGANPSLFDLHLCDLNGDGLAEAISTHNSSQLLSIFQNNSTLENISFTKTDYNLGGFSQSVASGDLDGDGRPDLVISGFGTSQNRLFLIRNQSADGAINLAAPLVFMLPDNGAGQIALHDLDLDGRPELIMTNKTNQNIFVFKNESSQGTIRFNQTPIIFATTGNNTFGLSIADLDGDNKPEIIASANLGSNVFILPNRSSAGNISFGEVQVLNTPSGLINLMAGDLDGDGKPDIAVTNIQHNNLTVWLNRTTEAGQIQFSALKNFPTDLRPYGLQLGDINGDGLPEILVGHIDSQSLAIMHNISTPGNLLFEKLSITGLEKNRHGRVGDVDGDGKPEILYTSTETNKLSVIRNKICIEARLKPQGIHDLCEGTPFRLETYQGAGLSYEWKRNGTLLANENQYYLDVQQSGDYSVNIQNQRDNCNSNATSVRVNITAGVSLESPEFYAIEPVCEGQAIVLNAKPVAGASYIWSGPNGFSRTTTTASTRIEASTQAMEGTYQLQIKNGPCSSGLLSQFADILPLPKPAIQNNGAASLCAGETTQLSVAGNFISYQWKIDGRTISGATGANLEAREAGAYTVVVSSIGCSSESEALQISGGDAPQAKFSAPASTCISQEFRFSNETSTNGGTLVYSWDFGDGNGSSVQNPSHSYENPGTYTVSLTTRYQSSTCQSQISKTIRVLEAEENIELKAPEGSSFCEGESVALVLSGELLEAEWSNGESGREIRVSEPGTYTAEIKTASGCNTRRSITVSHLPAEEIKIETNKTLLNAGEYAQLKASGALSYVWLPSEGLNDPFSDQPIAMPLTTTTYTVSGTNEAGCESTAEITIEVDNSVLIKTNKIFIPSRESFWRVERIEFYPELSLSIMNRTGKVIFSAKPYRDDWDGWYNGQPLNEGVYYYVFKDKGGKPIQTGTITLIH